MWTPKPEGIVEVRTMLLQGVDPKASTETLNQARARLDELSSTNPEFVRYLVYIFVTPLNASAASTTPTSSETASRALAGLILKNSLKRNWTVDPGTLGYIHESVLPCLRDSNKLIRSTAGHILAQLIAKTKILQTGLNILEQLKQCVVQEENDSLSDGASLTLLFIAEDAGPLLDSDEAGRPLNHLIPFWIEQATHVKPLLRERALDCIEFFFSAKPRALYVNVNAYLATLSRLQNDASGRVRRKVLRALCLLLQYMPETVSPDLFLSMAQFSMRAMGDEEDEVAREGCEFFDVALTEGTSFSQLLTPLLPTLIPLLLARMTYSEDELFELEEETQANSHIVDQPQDWKPIFQNGLSTWSSRPMDLRREDEGLINEDENGDETATSAEDSPYWTTRRTASLVLDRLSKEVNAAALAQVFLPVLFTRLQSKSWVERESAILALGAVAEGALIEHLKPNLENLLKFLLEQASDESRVLIRRIALWALSRFAPFVVDSPFFLQASLEVILARFNDKNKSVQAASLGSLAELFQACEGKPVMMPFLRTILERMTMGFDTFQMNNIHHLLDAFTALFKSHPTNTYLSDPALMQIYMPKIWARFEQCGPDDVNLPAMTWFLAQACSTLGPSFLPFAEPALIRCRDIMEETLSVAQSALDVGEPLGYGDFEHLQCTLELMSSLVSGLKASFIQSPNSQKCVQLVFQCASFLPDPDVIEVAVGVLGDVCMFCPQIVSGSERDLITLFIRVGEDIDMARMQSGACRNAVWAFTELVKSMPRVIQEIPQVVLQAVKMAGTLMLYREEKVEFSFETADVAASLTSALSLVAPEQFQVAFNEIGQRAGHPLEALISWTKILFRMNVKIPSRNMAIEGWAMFILARMDSIQTIVPIVLTTIASFDFTQSDPRLHQVLTRLAQSIKATYGANADEWSKKLKPLRPEMIQVLRAVYGL